LVQFWVGVSGFSYVSWRGKFYPGNAKPQELLAHYAAKLSSVEINSSFYSIPNPRTCTKWAESVPAQFRFSFKANRRITHIKKLKDVKADTAYFVDSIKPTEPKLGCILVQLPPLMQKDANLLEAFLNETQGSTRVALEFRHRSWFTSEITELLGKYNAALCVADTEEEKPVFEKTADFAYVRLRRDEYTQAELEKWAKALSDFSKEATDCFIYFKHDEKGDAAVMAQTFQQML